MSVFDSFFLEWCVTVGLFGVDNHSIDFRNNIIINKSLNRIISERWLPTRLHNPFQMVVCVYYVQLKMASLVYKYNVWQEIYPKAPVTR